ncbi:cupin [Legionella norrlandica]|uniref:Cupin n=1 Tax=Legionella norrlandica TaxID=1498499 RepID=A0A0A2T5A5_9GAMM|nr:cupin-like domain-containing protein [Legionella norrlandica]KGP62618.1 cupin [Legionella norrlandica]
MKFKKIRTIIYHYGDEELLKRILYQSKEPILIKIPNFTSQFSLNYFEQLTQAKTTYCVFENKQCVGFYAGNFAEVITQIKNNNPIRIFGQIFSRERSKDIEQHIPLWQKIPLRPRYFRETKKVTYFFGGKGAVTEIHFDREQCCNLHLCLSGKKSVLLFTEEQNDKLYKLPFVGDSLIDFTQPMDVLCQQFPKLNHAEGYQVQLEKGDMLFMPRNCWHYTEYLDASAAATYVFYPQKILQFYGYFTGNFFLGYKEESGFKIYKWPFFEKFNQNYAFSSGNKKFVFKLIEAALYLIMLPTVSLLNIISHKIKPRRVF